ncbi:MAG: NAD-dependent epimerase/dehydratase family protein [Bacteroidales bacterium]
MDKTVLITGGSGYLGSWVVKGLLDKGYKLRVAVRSLGNKLHYSHLLEIAGSNANNISFFEADLLNNGSYDNAAEGADAIIHMASPFTLRFRNAQKDLIDPAVNGTRNVLSAASKSTTVKKVVLTSSIAAVYGDNADLNDLGVDEFSEEYFNFSSTVKHQPYSYSKTMAEKEAWRLYNEQSKWKLVVINPTLVMGPSLTGESNSESLKIMSDLLSGKYKMGVPDLHFGFVDVRDVANAHILALEDEKAQGRHILVSRVENLLSLANIIEREFPCKFKLPHKIVPKILMLFVSWAFGFSFKFILRNVGYKIKVSNRRSIEVLGLKYIDFEKTIMDMVR